MAYELLYEKLKLVFPDKIEKFWFKWVKSYLKYTQYDAGATFLLDDQFIPHVKPMTYMLEMIPKLKVDAKTEKKAVKTILSHFDEVLSKKSS